MIVWQIFAFVLNETVQCITNCDNYEDANRIARAVYGDSAFAVDCLQYPCQVGDKYINGVFYHIDPKTQEQTFIQYVPTKEEQVEHLLNKNKILV